MGEKKGPGAAWSQPERAEGAARDHCRPGRGGQVLPTAGVGKGRAKGAREETRGVQGGTKRE